MRAPNGLDVQAATRFVIVVRMALAVAFLIAIQQGSIAAYRIAVVYTVINAIWRVRGSR